MTEEYPTRLKLKNTSNSFERVIDIIKAIRNARVGYNVPDNKKTNIYFLVKEDDMLLQLTSCHVRKADVIFLVVFDNADVCVLNVNFCHRD